MHRNVEFLTRFNKAQTVFACRIIETVPDDLIVRERATGNEVRPDHFGYINCLNKFKSDLSDQRSFLLLSFLYQHEKYLKHDVGVFARSYKHLFDPIPSKWEAILYNFPKIDQTTVCKILSPIPETAIGYKLEDFERVGLIDRSSLRPPNPKHVNITSKGIEVIEASIHDVIALLGPSFGIVEDISPKVPPEPNGESRPSFYR